MRRRNSALGCALAVVLAASGSAAEPGALYIRTSQLGFLPGEPKEAVILSHRDLRRSRFEILRDGREAYAGEIVSSARRYGSFSFVHRIDFSPVRDSGTYTVRVLGRESLPFRISPDAYEGLVDSLLLFFRVQRCGDSGALLHGPCHLHDATALRRAGLVQRVRIDATGGWHDAGDYVKFLNTTAYATYVLLFAYEFDPAAFGGDAPGRETPAILQEAAVGLEWLLKLQLSAREQITQVQDLRDHDQGWRLPEDDPLARDRPAFAGTGKNLVGIFTAVMACAYRTWRERDPLLADRCLTAAENAYSHRAEVPDLDSSGTGMYRDLHFRGKLALGAVELFMATGHAPYLAEAREDASMAGPDFWWSWGDINSFAHYRLASLDRSFARHIRKNLASAENISRGNVFGEAAPGSWGSVNAMLGAALQAVLWRRLTGEPTFDTLALRQCNYILGENPWGVSFMANVGKNPARHFHSQVAYLRGGYIPGALAAGPVPAPTLRQYLIPFEEEDRYAEFQSEGAVYRDDRMDYVTNEPTISAAATAVFVMGCRARGGNLADGGDHEHP